MMLFPRMTLSGVADIKSVVPADRLHPLTVWGEKNEFHKRSALTDTSKSCRILKDFSLFLPTVTF